MLSNSQMHICVAIACARLILAQQAVVVKPVIDLTLCPTAQDIHDQLPCSSAAGTQSCLRSCQLLFNTQVTIVKQTDRELLCKLSHVFYNTQENKKSSYFWTLKENLVLVDTIADTSALPDNMLSANTLQIVLPLYDPHKKLYYSAGTRFVRETSLDTPGSYAIKVYDNVGKKIYYLTIDRKNAITSYPANTKKARQFLINTIRRWIAHAAATDKKVIPYIWGGCSYIDSCQLRDFYKNQHYWLRKSLLRKPHTGFDCSSLILHAAQIAGLPYYFKDTITIERNLPTMIPGKNTLEIADLIWWPGHVVLISDLEKNLAIEAAGYDKGRGLIHEVPLNTIFKNIKNYRQLVSAYRHKWPLELLHANGSVCKIIKEFKLLKLL